MKLCKDCGKPGRFNMMRTSYRLSSGELKKVSYERSSCNVCQYRKANNMPLTNEVKPNPKVIKPYKDLLGPSTSQMIKEGKIKRRQPRFDSNSDGNGDVAFGGAFKWLKG